MSTPPPRKNGCRSESGRATCNRLVHRRLWLPNMRPRAFLRLERFGPARLRNLIRLSEMSMMLGSAGTAAAIKCGRVPCLSRLIFVTGSDVRWFLSGSSWSVLRDISYWASHKALNKRHRCYSEKEDMSDNRILVLQQGPEVIWLRTQALFPPPSPPAAGYNAHPNT